MNLNKEQEAVANAHDGVFVTIAGPGSGKTTTLIRRHKRMLEAGIDSKDIVNLTFTHSAAENMVKKAGVIGGDSVFKTFHSFAMDMLKKERDQLPFKLCDTIIPVSAENYKLLFELCKHYPAIKSWRDLEEKISSWKKRNVSPETALKEAVGLEYFSAKAYNDYEIVCREQGWLDFDSMMQEAVSLLENNPDVRNRHKRKYIAADECQDTDSTQFRMLQLLYDGNILVVGDENQLIYEWRSAQSGNLTNFSRMFPGAQTMFLGQNYRSTKKLVEFFKKILPVDNGLASHMFTENEEGTDPEFLEYLDDDQEREGILSRIPEDQLEQSVIIARTNRQLFEYQKDCTRRGIKYRNLGKKDFWEQNEVKKLLALAKNSEDFRPAHIVLSDLIKKENLVYLYRNSGRPMESNPVENLNSVVKLAEGKGNIFEFMAYLRKKTRGRKSAKGLTLSTVHQAKGMEWDHVYVVGARQGMMPHKDGEIKEEHRIFFVACTRAGKTLTISFSGSNSQFINDFVDQIQES